MYIIVAVLELLMDEQSQVIFFLALFNKINCSDIFGVNYNTLLWNI